MTWEILPSAHTSSLTSTVGSAKTQPSRSSNEEIKKSIYKNFVEEMDYRKPEINSTNKELEAWMHAEMYAQGIQCPELEAKLHLAASLIELAFHEYTLSEKKVIAVINWYVIYMDDISNTDDRPCAEFPHRLLRGLPQLDPVLDSLASALLSLYDYYEAPVANGILMSVLELVSSTFMESKMVNNKLTIPDGATHFPSFLRDRTGVGVAFALFPFTKSLGLDTTEHMCALPDMNFWICFSNDLLSYHKEELAGEKYNYVENRAFVECKNSMQVLAEIERELANSRNRIYAALAPNPVAVETWRRFETGVVAWHLEQDRYKLKDLAL